MNYLDIILLIPLIWYGYQGYQKGLLLQFVSLAALVLGFYVAVKFSNIVQAYLQSYIVSEYIDTLAFVLTCIGTIIGIHFLGKLLNNILNKDALGLANRLLGLVFSVFKITLILGTLLILINRFDKTLIKTEGSMLVSPMSKTAASLLHSFGFDVQGIMPSSMLSIDKAQKTMNSTVDAVKNY